MARTGRPKAVLELSDEERLTLEQWARRPKTAQALALRARIVLACAGGASNKQVSLDVGVSDATVGKWRRRFIGSRLDGLLDEPRPGQPRKITDRHVEEVITRTLESMPPDGATEWSTRQMAAATGLNQTAISRIWRAFGLAPHRQETWKLSKDPLFIEKVRDIVGLYLDPPERAVVLCVDEKSQIQALDRSAPVLPMLPGHAGPRDARLQAQRNLEPVRRAGPRQRQGDRLAAFPPSRGRVQEVLADPRLRTFPTRSRCT